MFEKLRDRKFKKTIVEKSKRIVKEVEASNRVDELFSQFQNISVKLIKDVRSYFSKAGPSAYSAPDKEKYFLYRAVWGDLLSFENKYFNPGSQKRANCPLIKIAIIIELYNTIVKWGEDGIVQKGEEQHSIFCIYYTEIIKEQKLKNSHFIDTERYRGD